MVHLPPPLHGVSLLNNIIVNSTIINEGFIKKIVKFKYSNKLSDIGLFSALKFFNFIITNLRIIYYSISFRPSLIYLTVPPVGIGFLVQIPVLLFLRLTSSKIIVHIHGKGLREYIERRHLIRLLYGFALRGIHIIHLSEKLFSEDFGRFNKQLSSSHIVANGIEVKNHTLKRKELIGNLNFIFLSNLFESKGVFFLFDILTEYASLNKMVTNFTLHIVGACPDENTWNKLKRCISRCSFEVIYHGPLYDEAKFELLSTMNIAIYPSFNDAFPLTLLEFLGVGIPVVASDQGAIGEIVVEGVGSVFKTGDLQDALHALDKVVMEYRTNSDEIISRCVNRYKLNYSQSKFEIELSNVLRLILCAE